ncbi:MAG: hypothetical protein M1335_00355 [Chloroflexi bacterium]|nr:hypothetical protein [Chloroflexota bacterium]
MKCQACGKTVVSEDGLCPACGGSLDVAPASGDAAIRPLGKPTEPMSPMGPVDSGSRSSGQRKKLVTPVTVIVMALSLLLGIAFGRASKQQTPANKPAPTVVAERPAAVRPPAKQPPTTPEPEPVSTVPPASVIEQPTDVIKRYYQAVAVQNFNAAKQLMTQAAAGRYDPDALFGEAPKIISYDVQAVDADAARATVKATERATDPDYGDRTYTVTYTLVKPESTWLIGGFSYDQGDEQSSGAQQQASSAQQPSNGRLQSATPDERKAVDLVTAFLSDLKANRIDGARALVSDHFAGINTAYFNGGLADLTDFQILDKSTYEDTVEVTVTETRDDVERLRYGVTFPSTGPVIVYVTD